MFHQLVGPAKLKEKNPHFNSQAGEQTFVWVGRFRHILCAMKKCNHLFFLHRMVLRRNSYTCKCYVRGKKPILYTKNMTFIYVEHVLNVYFHGTILQCYVCT